MHIHPQTHTHPPLVESTPTSLFCRYDNQTLRTPTLSCAAILTQMQRVVRGGLARRLSKRRRIHNRRLESAPGRFFVAPATDSVTSRSLRFSSALYLLKSHDTTDNLNETLAQLNVQWRFVTFAQICFSRAEWGFPTFVFSFVAFF